ncbi:MAG TPA: GAF domain-containing protein [Holophaga sp.]|nr:GAF domain-containing protein [Holophaga sp.]
MSFTVALPIMHRCSLEDRLGREILQELVWSDAAPADVVLALPGEGALADCPVWLGEEGALALIETAFKRLEDQRRMEQLNRVGRALASEQNLDRLLDMILVQARELLAAEGGSIYLVVGEGDARELLFAHTQNSKVGLPYHRFRMPISDSSMAGFVAGQGRSLNIEDVYHIPGSAPYQFNDSFDRQARYRSISMLSVPMRDGEGEVLGVLQLINRVDESEPSRPVVPFLAQHQSLAESLAGQAGVAVKNAHLRGEIERLLEGFVNASVLAIEQRDPVTSGHSGRVATLTVGLAEAINAAHEGPYAEVHFSDRQLRELRYASLLHDFGKVGVREQVLVKSKKLDPAKLELILQRIAQRRLERALAALEEAWERGDDFDPIRWRLVLDGEEAEANRLIALILQSNEPTVLSQDVVDGLGNLAALRYTHWNGQVDEVVALEDIACLSIRKGSLSDTERLEIESHVTHTFHFLEQIPWTKDLAEVPEIAFAHHERVNGKGYPRRIANGEIPVQSKAMAIADVFDALTAQDRPYKAALPLERSLRILEEDAKAGHLDAALLDLFIQARVFDKLEPVR